jgi:ADP-ribose pyrophosphatase YjhB (NUDIX family)
VIVRHRTKEQYLFIQRKNNPTMPTWFVHGGIEEGQTLEDAVCAEVREEAGYDVLDIHNLNYICKFSRYAPHKNINRDGYAHLMYAEVDGDSLGQSSDDVDQVDVIYIDADQVASIIDADPLCQHSRAIYTQWKAGARFVPTEPTATPHLVPESELPVILPLDVANYKPKGKSPLADHATFPIYRPSKTVLLIHGRSNYPGDGSVLDALADVYRQQ